MIMMIEHYMDDTFDYIKSIKWHWDMSEEDHKRS